MNGTELTRRGRRSYWTLAAVAAVAGFVMFLGVIIVLADEHSLGFIYTVYDFPYGDKVGHFVLYGTLSLLADLALFQLWPKRDRTRLALMAGFTVVLLESLEELSQVWMPSRTVDAFDLLAS